jgi:hypothetical protein
MYEDPDSIKVDLTTLCSRCILISSEWKSTKLKHREIEDNARNLGCPLCGMIFDSLDRLPSGTPSETPGSQTCHISTPRLQNKTHARLTVGRQNGRSLL